VPKAKTVSLPTKQAFVESIAKEFGCPNRLDSEPNLSIIEEIVHKISDVSGAQGSVHCPRKSSREYPIFVGTFSQLKLCLDLIEEQCCRGNEMDYEIPAQEHFPSSSFV
jgi:hypothetical protein